MRRDGSHFFTTSYPPPPPPPQKPSPAHLSLSPSLSFSSEKIVAFAVLILSTPLPLNLPAPPSHPPHSAGSPFFFPLHIRSICPFIIWLVLFFDRSISKANTGASVVPLITQMARKMMAVMPLFSTLFREPLSNHPHPPHHPLPRPPSLLKRPLKLTGCTLREKSCLIAMQYRPPRTHLRVMNVFPSY